MMDDGSEFKVARCWREFSVLLSGQAKNVTSDK